MAQVINHTYIDADSIETAISRLLKGMSLQQKIGQLCLINTTVGDPSADCTRDAIKRGLVGGIINETNRDTINGLQKLAMEGSNGGIPLLFGRDVMHGFKTIFPIPLGLAASWNPGLAKETARLSAQEASRYGINWTYAPMVDICRDPRWGRVAESFGEDTCLTSKLATAMVEGFQGRDLRDPDSIAACIKHFAGYGASEGGKDYNTTNIPENELRNVHLPPFKAAIDAGVISIMTSFSDIDGIPASANRFLLQELLRDEWGFDGFVVSDWESISQLQVHGLAENTKDAAFEAASAGVDMEMASSTYRDHIAELIAEGKLTKDRIDVKVARILRAKYRLGLFHNPYAETDRIPESTTFVVSARQAATEACVLLKNSRQVLPMDCSKISSVAVIGPLADEPAEQLGTWVFDGDPSLSVTPLRALRDALSGSVHVDYVRALESSRDRNRSSFDDAIAAAGESDIVIMFLGEEAILTGEAHCRADIRLPGAQEELIHAVAGVGKPIVVVLMTGRPLALSNIVDDVEAILCTWHPGTQAGPAIVDLLLGKESPSGKLPMTFPYVTGQVPIYYSHKNTGRPANPKTVVHIDDIEVGADQQSAGDTSFYLDTPYGPLYPFGFGLTYTEFEYSNLRLSCDRIKTGEVIKVSVDLTNTGTAEACEIVQLYTRDLVGSVTRPVKELKNFVKLKLKPGEKKLVTFDLSTDDLAFYGRDNKLACEPGAFQLWVGGSSEANLGAKFEVI